MINILIHVEDPGAANIVVGLPEQLSKKGISCVLYASNTAVPYLSVRHQKLVNVDGGIAADIIEAHSPKLVVVGTSENPDGFDLALTAAAKTMNIPTVALIDMQFNIDRRFRGQSSNPLAYAPDWLAVPDEASQNAAIALGFPQDRVRICGHPHYDRIRSKRKELEHQDRTALRKHHFPGLDLDRPILLFAAEGVDQLNPKISFRDPDFTLHGRGTSDFRTAIVLEELIDAAKTCHTKPQIVLRLHPKNQRSDFTAYLNEVDTVSEGGDPLELMWAADGITGMSSMLLLEAYLLRLPTLSILTRPHEAEWLVTLANGLTPIAHTRQEVRFMLDELISGKLNPVQEQDTLSVGGLAKLTTAIKELTQFT